MNNRLQDNFIRLLSENEIRVAVYLTNGKRLDGIIVDSDNFSILLVSESTSALIMKGNIVSIVPVRRLTGGEIEKIIKGR